jgi:hypothetical protein
MKTIKSIALVAILSFVAIPALSLTMSDDAQARNVPVSGQER